jgi:hypothetical protein
MILNWTVTNIIVAVTKLHASRPRKDSTHPFRSALSHQYSVATFTTLRVLSCIHSPGSRYSSCNVIRFCCDLQVCNLVTANIVMCSSLLRECHIRFSRRRAWRWQPPGILRRVVSASFYETTRRNLPEDCHLQCRSDFLMSFPNI